MRHGAELRFVQADSARSRDRHGSVRYIHRWNGILPHGAKDRTYKDGKVRWFKCAIHAWSDDPMCDLAAIKKVTLIQQGGSLGGRRYRTFYRDLQDPRDNPLTRAQEHALRWARRRFYVEG